MDKIAFTFKVQFCAPCNDEIKTAQSLTVFKQCIISWNGNHCVCNIWKCELLLYLFYFILPYFILCTVIVDFLLVLFDMLVLFSLYSYCTLIQTINKLIIMMV